MNTPEEILELAECLEKAAAKLDTKVVEGLEEASLRAAKSWSGSWLGYHSRVYYKNFAPTPPGARFSIEWGFGDRLSNETHGEWGEYDFDAVVGQIEAWAGSPYTDKMKTAAKKAETVFDDSKSLLLSYLSSVQVEYSEDKFLAELTKTVETEEVLTYRQFVEAFRGKRQWFTRDAVAGGQGMQTPPHFHVLANVGAYKHPFNQCANLAKHARRLASHVQILEKRKRRTPGQGTHVFIGHGRSPLWKDFRDFIRDRVKLPWDEYNRVPIAGIPTTTRLMQMLDDAAIAFLILTAEDEQADGTFHPRMNVIHEAGLFQGRIGLQRAIILLEEGCEEFSNVHGLGQIRFPRGDISPVFEEVRRVLEREELIATASGNSE